MIKGRQLVRIVRRMHQSAVRIPARSRIMNLTRVGLVAEIHDQVAGLLGSPCAGTVLWGTRVTRRKLDCLNPNLQKMKAHVRRKDA